MDKFPGTNHLLTVKHEKIENLNRPKTGNEIKSVFKTSQQRKAQDQKVSLVNSTKPLKII